MSDDRERLDDVLEAIERIDRYTARGREAFEGDELIQTWVLHHLRVIGEACRALSPELRDAYPEVPWTKITGMRNVLVHGYFEVDREIVWTTVDEDLPDLARQLQDLRTSLEP